ncbi:MAG: HAD family hydrolase [Planctomycetaceae bacterium]|nr:HAD family hydrolase [Planctomycetaceae bacterium]
MARGERSSWEWHRPWISSTRLRCAVFDFDGTLSLIRGGWTEVMVTMMVDHLLTLPNSTDGEPVLREIVRHYVLGLNGKPTIYQMQRFAEEIANRGGVPGIPEEYHREYLQRLGVRIDERKARIRAGESTPDDVMVPGARAFLTALADAGVELTLASGTELDFVREEARVLQIDHFFEGRIFGPGADPHAFSKRQVMQDLLSRHRIDGNALIGVGDGVVETQNMSELGGLTIGVASDEQHRAGACEPWKRERLIESGANLIIPDYHDAAELAERILFLK